MTSIAILLGIPLTIFGALVLGVCGAYARFAVHARRGLAGVSVGLILREAWAQLVVVGWTLARRGRAIAHSGDGRPVVLVHGLAADGSSMWAYRRALIAHGRATWSPHLGGMFRPVEKYAARLVHTLESVDGDEIDVVCHSMGGVILRACLAARPDLAARVRHVVTVASPHLGTAGARGLPLAEARQLHVGAAWLGTLPTLRALLPNGVLTTVASDTDAVVYPKETCCVDGAEHHVLSGVGHAELLVRQDVVDLVVDAVS